MYRGRRERKKDRERERGILGKRNRYHACTVSGGVDNAIAPPILRFLLPLSLFLSLYQSQFIAMPTLSPLLLNSGPSRLARRMTDHIEHDSDDEDYNPSSITHGSDDDEDEDEAQDEDEDEEIVICTQFTVADKRGG